MNRQHKKNSQSHARAALVFLLQHGALRNQRTWIIHVNFLRRKRPFSEVWVWGGSSRGFSSKNRETKDRIFQNDFSFDSTCRHFTKPIGVLVRLTPTN